MKKEQVGIYSRCNTRTEERVRNRTRRGSTRGIQNNGVIERSDRSPTCVCIPRGRPQGGGADAQRSGGDACGDPLMRRNLHGV